MPNRKKLTGATGGRAVKEWIGKTPDTPVPPAVRLRVWNRQLGVCAVTTRKIRPGDKKRLDHKVPLNDWTGDPPHGNRESNLQWLLDTPHKDKTKAEAAVRKKVQKRAKSHAGIKRPTAPPLKSRNDLPVSKHAERRVDKLPPPSTPSNLQRRYGIVEPSAKKTR